MSASMCHLTYIYAKKKWKIKPTPLHFLWKGGKRNITAEEGNKWTQQYIKKTASKINLELPTSFHGHFHKNWKCINGTHTRMEGSMHKKRCWKKNNFFSHLKMVGWEQRERNSSLFHTNHQVEQRRKRKRLCFFKKMIKTNQSLYTVLGWYVSRVRYFPLSISEKLNKLCVTIKFLSFLAVLTLTHNMRTHTQTHTCA